MIYKAVWGMVKNGSLARKQMRKLRIFNQAEHKHEAQKPMRITTL
jgi:ribosomal protein L13